MQHSLGHSTPTTLQRPRRSNPIRAAAKSLIRTSSFYSKWLAEVLREPSLMLSLVLGPFLILFLFGAGTTVGGAPKPRTVVVAPAGQTGQNPMELLPQDVGDYLTIVDVVSDPQEAVNRLTRRDVDLVAVLPANPEQMLSQGQRAKIRIFTNEIDPLRDSYAQAYLYYQISTLNQTAIEEAVARAQGSAGQMRQFIGQAKGYVQQMRTAQNDAARAEQELRQLRTQLDPMAAALREATTFMEGLVGTLLPGFQEPLDELRAATATVENIQRTIDQFQTRLAAGGNMPTPAELDQIDAQLVSVEQAMAQMTAIPPEVLSAPFELELSNVAAFELSAINFYAPAVLALLLQHLAVTLGALSMARVRLLGLMELLQTSPVRPIEAVIGNYLSYGTLCVAAGSALIALLVGLLGVPLLGPPVMFAATVLLLILCSLGIGFVISMIARSEQQAAQIAMLVLIASVFFSGFMIFLDSITWPIRAVSYLLPATYAIGALRDIMLRGLLLSPVDLYVLLGAAIAFFAITLLLFRREFRPR
jgi:ABC-2 type transport system permease protein